MVYERKNQGTCSVLTRVELNPDHTIEAVSVLGDAMATSRASASCSKA